MKKRKFEIKNAFGIVIIVAVVVVFLLMINGGVGIEMRKKVYDKDKLVAMDLTKEYPSSPREVVTLYSRIIKCMYNEKYEDEEFKMLLDRMRMLMDEELLDKNPYDEQRLNVIKDIEEYKAEKKTISSFKVAASDDVTYQNLEGKDYSFVATTYNTESSKGQSRTKQQYVLRKDSNGNWRILYWLLMTDNDKE